MDESKPSEAVSPQPGEPLLFNKKSMLERFDGDEELALEILELYVDDAPNQIQAVKQAIEENQPVGVERSAHTLKGASANVSADAMRASAFELEKAGKAGDLVLAKSLLSDVEQRFHQLIVYLRDKSLIS